MHKNSYVWEQAARFQRSQPSHPLNAATRARLDANEPERGRERHSGPRHEGRQRPRALHHR